VATSKQRREAERRRLQRQVQRRAQREARQRRLLMLVSVLGVIVVVATVVVLVVVLGGDDKKKPKAGGGGSPTTGVPTSTSPSPTGNTASCSWTKTKDAARTVQPPPTSVPRTGTMTVSVTTNRGPLTFTLDRAKTPCTVASFVSLAAQKYYDGTSCHRLTSGSLSVLQCGDPLGNGSGGPGYQFKDELSGGEKYTRGVLAMANSGPNTNGSQFFIVYKDSQLPASYTVFGTVTKGLDVVDKVAAGGSVTAGDGKPKLPITLQKVTVAE